MSRRKIGVLAVQGGFEAHLRALAELGHQSIEVRSLRDLELVEGLVLPGGESTTQLRLIAALGLEEPLRAFVAQGRPILATCAGLILSAKTVSDPVQRSFGFIDAEVRRNAWGRQLDSFEASADDSALPLVFIRAPRVASVGPGVDVLARYQGEPILIRQGAVYGATFHPELTSDRGIHSLIFG